VTLNTRLYFFELWNQRKFGVCVSSTPI